MLLRREIHHVDHVSTLGVSWLRVALLLAMLTSAFSNVVRADEPPKSPAAPSAETRDDSAKPSDSTPKADATRDESAEEVALHVKRLTTGTAAERLQAMSRLLELKQSAVEPLAKEAGEGNPTTMFYCFDALQKLLAHEHEPTAKAAKASLEKLSESPNRAVALRAKSVQRLHEVLGRRQVAPGNKVAQPVIPAGNVFSLTTTNKDGKKIRIQRAADGSFTGSITEKTIDGEKSTDIAAADSKELEQKFPEAHQALKAHEERVRQAQINLAQQGVPQGGALNLNIQANGLGGGHRIRTSIVNGVRTTDITIGNEKITINDVNGKNITLKHTRPVDGKEKTDEYKGADLDDLRKNHPEGAKLYEKYAANNALMPQIQIQGNVNGGIQLFPTAEGIRTPVGPRTINVDLEGTRLEIADEGGRHITVKVIKTVEGKDVIEEFRAENAQQLKVDHPDIAKLYEKYTGLKTD